jgi:hypothetical protein
MKIRFLLILVLFGFVAKPMLAQGYKLSDVITNDDGSRGVVFYVNPDGSGGWMVALNDASTGCPWGTTGDIPALANQNLTYNRQQLMNDTDGYANTEQIRAYQNNSTTYAAGKVDFANGWYLPSAGQLRKLFGNLAKIEGAIAAAGGSTLSSSNSYWSSTEKDASQAWIVATQTNNYSGLIFSNSNKTNSNSVRAIHDFGGGQTIVYDTTLYYYWNTGATTPYIEVSPSQTTTYTVTASTEFGCSATAEQTVFVNPSGTEYVYDTVCAGYAYSGYGFELTPEQTQTQGEATFSRDIGGGDCTATLTLHLYKRGPTVGPTLTASTCENEAYYYNSYAYSVAGTYHQYYTAASGCDSIVTINLSVLPVSSSTIEQETCNSLTWNGEVYTESGTYEQTLQNQHGCDSVVTMHLTVNHDITRVISETTCNNYTWNGQVYNESGQYTQTFSASTGCDSIVTLNLTVIPGDTTSLYVTTCDEYEWYGNTYNGPGIYEHLLQSSAGCDSLLILDLSIGESFIMEYSESACNSFFWRGNTYCESGVYYDTVPSPSGCDSLFILNLNLGFDMMIDTSATACSVFEWNGIEYTETGDYEQTFQSVQGCDSIVTLHLTINDILTSEWSWQSCDSYTWNGVEYTETGDYEQTFLSVQGCDSIVTLHLTINNVLTSEWAWQACASYTWNGVEYTETGDYEQTFQSVQGCDSIVTLHLTINDVLTSEWTYQSCNSYTWNGIEYTQSGDYEQTFQSVQGCDSIVTLHLEFVESYETYLDTVHCGSYWFNGQEIETSGYYEGEFVSSDGCDSIVHLQLTVEHFPEAPIMEGQHTVYVATDLLTGIYHYEANPVPNATHYEWSLTSPGWLMDTIGTSCTLTVIYPGTGTLTFRAWNECGYSEIQKVINAGFFDIAEHEMVFVNVYPNPAKYKAVVESEGILRIKVYSMTGQLLQEIEGNGDDSMEISLRDYAPATYMLEVTTQKGSAHVKLNVVR